MSNSESFIKRLNSEYDRYFMSTEKRYLVYRTWNGQTHCSIEHGQLETGEGVKKDPYEIKRFEIKHKVTDIKILKELYPVEKD